MKDVMLDFETLGNGTNKCVCQVGAIFFDKTTGELGPSFKANIDVASHIKHGAVIDAPTVYWWLNQSEPARQSILQTPLKDVKHVFEELNSFLEPAARVWSHATFDFVTLVETLKQLQIKPKISYKIGLDLRTLVYLAGCSVKDFERTGIHHDALEDCKYQVKYAVSALNTIKTSKILINFTEKLLKE